MAKDTGGGGDIIIGSLKAKAKKPAKKKKGKKR